MQTGIFEIDRNRILCVANGDSKAFTAARFAFSMFYPAIEEVTISMAGKPTFDLEEILKPYKEKATRFLVWYDDISKVHIVYGA
jgi:hypothetical protein